MKHRRLWGAAQPEFETVLRRANGRFVQVLETGLPSKYAAKKARGKAEQKYDDSYYVQIREADNGD